VASIIDFNDSLEVNRCSSQMDTCNAKKWKEELDEGELDKKLKLVRKLGLV